MNDKNNNSNTDEKPYFDSGEFFDIISERRKKAESPDCEKEFYSPDKPSDQTDWQKVKKNILIKKTK